MSEVKRIKINEGFQYDEELFVEGGEYEFIEEGTNGYPEIKVNEEWLDLCDLEAIDYVVVNEELKRAFEKIESEAECFEEYGRYVEAMRLLEDLRMLFE